MNIERLFEELASASTITIYHNSQNRNLSGVMANDDYTPGEFGAGSMHGKGFYSVWKKEEVGGKGNYNRYGSNNYKGTVPLNSNILVLDPDFYKEIYKKEPSINFIEDQLIKAGVNVKDMNTPLYIKGKFYKKNPEELLSKNFNKRIARELYKESTSTLLYNINGGKGTHGSGKGSFLQKYFDGVAYWGSSDLHCLLMWNYKLVKIIGKYNKSENKTKINIKDYKKQKENKFRNETIFSSKKVKIIERNGFYYFIVRVKNSKEGDAFFGLKPNQNVITDFKISRDQKHVDEYSNAFKDFDKIEKFKKEYNIPDYVINSLTFTNGKKMNDKKNAKEIIINRNKKGGEFTKEDFDSLIRKKTFFKEIQEYCDNLKKGDNRENDFPYDLENFINASPKNAERVKNIMKGRPLRIKSLHTLPDAIENSVDTVLVNTSKSKIFNPVSYSYFSRYDDKFLGKLKGFPSKMVSSVNFLPFFKNKKLNTVDCSAFKFMLFIVGDKGNDEENSRRTDYETLRKVINEDTKYINCAFKNLYFDSGKNSYGKDFAPPCLFGANYKGSKIDDYRVINLSNLKKINFGNNSNFWKFNPKIIDNLTQNVIFCNEELDKKSILELKKRNPKFRVETDYFEIDKRYNTPKHYDRKKGEDESGWDNQEIED